MGDFKQLVAWREGNALARDIHAVFTARASRDYPGLRAQVLRAAASIPATLSEGCAKRSRNELARFAEMAYASAKEVENHLILSRTVNILTAAQFVALAKQTDHVAALCYGLAKKPPPSLN
jgi:four helix bundle protein